MPKRAAARPGRADILACARAMVPMLREKALQSEGNRLIPAEPHRAFANAGVYNLFHTARVGVVSSARFVHVLPTSGLRRLRNADRHDGAGGRRAWPRLRLERLGVL